MEQIERHHERWARIRDWIGILIAVLIGVGAVLLSVWTVVNSWLGF